MFIGSMGERENGILLPITDAQAHAVGLECLTEAERIWRTREIRFSMQLNEESTYRWNDIGLRLSGMYLLYGLEDEAVRAAEIIYTDDRKNSARHEAHALLSYYFAEKGDLKQAASAWQYIKDIPYRGRVLTNIIVITGSKNKWTDIDTEIMAAMLVHQREFQEYYRSNPAEEEDHNSTPVVLNRGMSDPALKVLHREEPMTLIDVEQSVQSIANQLDGLEKIEVLTSLAELIGQRFTYDSENIRATVRQRVLFHFAHAPINLQNVIRAHLDAVDTLPQLLQSQNYFTIYKKPYWLDWLPQGSLDEQSWVMVYDIIHKRGLNLDSVARIFTLAQNSGVTPEDIFSRSFNAQENQGSFFVDMSIRNQLLKLDVRPVIAQQDAHIRFITDFFRTFSRQLDICKISTDEPAMLWRYIEWFVEPANKRKDKFGRDNPRMFINRFIQARNVIDVISELTSKQRKQALKLFMSLNENAVRSLVTHEVSNVDKDTIMATLLTLKSLS